ncbi:MAG: DUF4398 and OmpA-like domain-containing protein [Burkholderiales bacterium]|nr:DUF4398 and OmpA-like domain-containing protein [Burkholderiales bacterium]
MNTSDRTPLLAVMTAALLAGCASTPTNNADLDQAKQAYTAASNDALVLKHAPSELESAHLALDRADKNWKQEHDAEETHHLAYIAQQRVKIAEQAAMGRDADARIAQSTTNREKLIADARTVEADQAKARAAALQRELEALSAKQTDRGMVITLHDVLFDTGRANLKEGGMDMVNRLAAVLREYPDRRVLIEGHTDSTGSGIVNQALSEHRADAVKLALQNDGIAGDRIDTHGYGASKPVASNRTSAGRQQNRRVEIVISDAQGKVGAL